MTCVSSTSESSLPTLVPQSVDVSRRLSPQRYRTVGVVVARASPRRRRRGGPLPRRQAVASVEPPRGASRFGPRGRTTAAALAAGGLPGHDGGGPPAFETAMTQSTSRPALRDALGGRDPAGHRAFGRIRYSRVPSGWDGRPRGVPRNGLGRDPDPRSTTSRGVCACRSSRHTTCAPRYWPGKFPWAPHDVNACQTLLWSNGRIAVSDHDTPTATLRSSARSHQTGPPPVGACG